MYAALLTTLLWSLSVVCAHRSAKMIGGTEANFWRLTLAALFLGFWAHTLGKGMGTTSFVWFFWSGIIGIGVGDVALFQALPRLGSRLSVLLIQCLSSPFAALIEFFWLGTRLTWIQILCGAVILLGVGMALTPGKHLTLTRRQITVGALFGALAAFGNACGAVFSRKGFAVAQAAGESIDGGTSAYQRVVGGLLIGGICLLFVKRSRIQSAETAQPIEKYKKVWPWVLANALAGQTIGVTFYQLALKSVPTGVVLSITALTPLVTIPFARYFENERPHPRSLWGGVIAVIGVLALIMSKHFAR